MNGINGFNAGALSFGNMAQENEDGLQKKYAVTVKKDGGVCFEVFAPEASSVNIQIDKKDYYYPLVKYQDGFWRLTLYDIPGGIHVMRWIYDGVEKICPKAPVIFQENGAYNYIDIPDAMTAIFSLQAVPHGSVRREIYYSGITGQYRVCWVYTPPGYDEKECRYPVLYALGGGEENETTWLWPGKINLMLEFCQYPYSPKRELPFGTEPPAAAVFESGRLRLYAFCKTADSIAVSFDMDEIKQRFYLESDGNGNWGTDIFRLPPGRYTMYWYYDGVLKLNRHAPVCFEKGEIRNFIEIPSNTPGEYELKDVLHGTLRHVPIFSTSKTTPSGESI